MNYVGLYTFTRREIERFLRTYLQSLVSPWISALLYIVIFGAVVGSQIGLIAEVRYIDFVLPGIVMLNLIQASFSQTSFSLYFMRFARHIEELLTAPLSHAEMVIGFVAAGLARGLVAGIGVYFIAIFFSVATIAHFGLFLFYAVSVSIIFSLIGLIVALWAKNFEGLSILNTFVITPLTFLGGVFNSITMLPDQAQFLVRLNPFFYFVDGLRYSMIGVQEANATIGIFVIFGLIVLFSGLVWHLFKIGWRIKS